MWTWLKNLLGIDHKKETTVSPVVVIDNKDEIVNTIVIEETIQLVKEEEKTVAVPATKESKPKRSKKTTEKVEKVSEPVVEATPKKRGRAPKVKTS